MIVFYILVDALYPFLLTLFSHFLHLANSSDLISDGEGDGDALAQGVEEATGGISGGEMEVTTSARLQAEGRFMEGGGG